MPELIDKAKLLEYLAAIKPDEYVSAYGEAAAVVINYVEEYVNEMPTIGAEPVRHGRWIECDYEEFRHVEIWTAHRAGLRCSVCGVPFHKKKMTYKQYCAACGTKMDGGSDD